MRKSILIVLIVLLALSCLSLLVVLCILGDLVHHQIQQEVQLVPNSTVFTQWVHLNVPIYLQIYFFNLTNPEAFKLGSKPQLNQLGPYTYLEERFKHHIYVNTTEGNIDYKETKRYQFVPAMSSGTEDDLITNINLVYLSLIYRITWLPQPLVRIFEIVERFFSDQLLMERPVREWLWGYKDPFLNALLKMHFPVNTSEVGLYVNRNNTDDGWIRVDAGTRHIDRLGHVISFHNQSNLPYWFSIEANQLNGTDGSLFHPFLTPEDPVDVFASDICRSIRFMPSGQVKVGSHKGLVGIKYTPLEDTFDSPKLNPKNRGFCLNWPVCYETGAHDMSTCQPGVPIAMSMPHFVNANQTYQDGVEGLHPSDEFNTTFIIEPVTGVVLHASKKLQLNVNVTKIAKSRELRNVTTVLLPVMFLNESVTLDDAIIDQLHYSTVVTPMIVKIICAVMLVIFLIGILVVIVVVFRERIHSFNPIEDQTLTTEGEEEEPTERQPLLSPDLPAEQTYTSSLLDE